MAKKKQNNKKNKTKEQQIKSSWNVKMDVLGNAFFLIKEAKKKKDKYDGKQNIKGNKFFFDKGLFFQNRNKDGFVKGKKKNKIRKPRRMWKKEGFGRQWRQTCLTLQENALICLEQQKGRVRWGGALRATPHPKPSKTQPKKKTPRNSKNNKESLWSDEVAFRATSLDPKVAKAQK